MSQMWSKKRAQSGAKINQFGSRVFVNNNMQDNLDVNTSSNLDYVFEQRNRDPRLYLPVSIMGTEVQALFDSGASHSVLGRKGLWIADKCPNLIQKFNGSVETADARKHLVHSVIRLPISLEERTREVDVLIVPTLDQTLILGMDFWKVMEFVPDVRNGTWEFAGTSHYVSEIHTGGLHDGENLTEEQKLKLQEIVKTYFDQMGDKLGRTHLVEHIIDTGDSPPIKQRYYPLSPARQKLVNEELDRMISLGVVEPSKSGWSSPIILLDKPDGSHRFVVDFRKVNAVTKRDAYPLPRVTSILDRLRQARYLSSLDIKSAYWQIPLQKESKERTAFTIPGRGLYHFNTMPFGLHNAPATWQRLIDQVLGVDLEPFVFVYLDDMIIVTPDFEQHIEILSKVFNRLKEANLTLNKDKCKFCRSELHYLGYVVDANGLQVDPQKVKAILEIPTPKNAKQVRQFCGTASWYRRFISNFATRIQPLTSLLKKNKKFIWTDEAEKAFQDIRNSLVNSPVLACPDFEKPFTIACDASGVGLGAVLSQSTDEGEVVIAYASRTLTKNEMNFSATERECLSVIFAVEKFRPYVEGTHFTVITDHYSLLWLQNLKDPQGRLARWALRLQGYDYTLVHRKGKEHVVPDMLSRAPVVEEIRVIEDTVTINDKWYNTMITNVTEKPGDYSEWRVTNGKLWKHLPSQFGIDEDFNNWKLVVPKDFRDEIYKECHDDVTAGHLGVMKTYLRAKQKYYWPRMRVDIARYVKSCLVCQKNKPDNRKPTGLMGRYRQANQPWSMISADLIGPLPRSTKGHRYILVVVDNFSKFCLLFPLRSATATAVARHLEEDVFMIYGIPRYVICDNGSEFDGHPVRKLADKYNVRLLYNAKYHPQANPTERTNKTIGTMLRSYVKDNQRMWDQNIPQIGFALRTAVNETTGFTPAYLNFGRELWAKSEVEPQDEPNLQPPSSEELSQRVKKMEALQDIFKDVKMRLEAAHRANEKRYNLRHRPLEFEVGDQVLKRNFVKSDAAKFFSKKLASKFVGPLEVTQKISPVMYQLKDETGQDIGRWHISDLRPFRPRRF
jgi:hypothetical protein